MNICLIDADSKIPNLALMKLSTYCKEKGHSVTLVKANLAYPLAKDFIVPKGYDRYFCSTLFNQNYKHIKGAKINFGGTGYNLSKSLPDKVECCEPDYSLYPDNEIAYGFLTRGCIRNCYFCVVPAKEGKLRQVSTIDKILAQGHKQVRFLDNNILGFVGHLSILYDLSYRRILCEFYQGLDIRLLNQHNSFALSKLRYNHEYIFALDTVKMIPIVSDKLKLLKWRHDWQIKFFVYVHPAMPIGSLCKRLNFLLENKCLPYMMRDVSCYTSELNQFYIDVCGWVNQPHLVKVMDFRTYLERRHPSNIDRVKKSLQIWKRGCND